tara:strand:+ start:3484 stop:4341 length:858 start_codon:yes stop_codon:yes gene_type:complete
MSVLGIGKANGGISILHALGLGKGCSIGIDLSTTVTMLDGNTSVKADDHGLLQSLTSCWRLEGLPLPSSFGWKVDSDVPIGQGLKSSSSLACAALRALNSATWAGLSDSELADLAVSAQREANCSITGSLDDTWAALSPGWKLVDPSLSASDSVLMEGELEEDLRVIIGLRGTRSRRLEPESFGNQSLLFERALASLITASPLEALSANGIAVAAATEDHEALRISNISIASGAVAAGITGSGPAIALVCFSQDSDAIQSRVSDYFDKIILSNFIPSEEVTEEVN